MAQTGFTPISLYYSATPGMVPSASNLVNGEMALNIADGILYYKNASGTVVPLLGTSGGIISLTAGAGLTGGTITDTGTIAIDNTYSNTWGSSQAFNAGLSLYGTNISAPSGGSSYYLNAAGGWSIPSNGVFLAANQTFTGTNTFTQYVVCTAGGGYSALQPSSIALGNVNTAIYFDGTQYNFIINGSSAGALSLAAFSINGIGYQPGGGTWTASSDARLKSNVTPLMDALATVKTLRPVTYTWNYDAKNEPTVGFIAQEVQAAIPNAVSSTKPTDAQKPFINDDAVLSIGWQNDIVAYLVKSIQELNVAVSNRAAQIAVLQSKLGN